MRWDSSGVLAWGRMELEMLVEGCGREEVVVYVQGEGTRFVHLAL